MAVGRSLGSSSPGFLGTHTPGTLDLGGPFPVASLWDGRKTLDDMNVLTNLSVHLAFINSNNSL